MQNQNQTKPKRIDATATVVVAAVVVVVATTTKQWKLKTTAERRI